MLRRIYDRLFGWLTRVEVDVSLEIDGFRSEFDGFLADVRLARLRVERLRGEFRALISLDSVDSPGPLTAIPSEPLPMPNGWGSLAPPSAEPPVLVAAATVGSPIAAALDCPAGEREIATEGNGAAEGTTGVPSNTPRPGRKRGQPIPAPSHVSKNPGWMPNPALQKPGKRK